MRSGELARRAGVNPQTLRYYERKGLLPGPPRTRAGYRHYPESAVERLRFIKRSQALGFTLREIAGLLDLKGARNSCVGAVQMAQEKLIELDAEMTRLQLQQAFLTDLMSRCGPTCEGLGKIG